MATNYLVKPGEDLRTIANRIYGDPKVWHEIARINGIRDPRRIRTGQVIKLP